MKASKIIAILLVTVFMSLNAAPVFALGILPSVSPGVNCSDFVKGAEMKKVYQNSQSFKKVISDPVLRDNILGCAIKTGRIKLYMMPFYVTYLVQFLLAVAGLISVLFVVYGGFRYAVGGLIEDKESGKKTIMYALLGLVVSLSAWMVVNFIMVALTS